MSTQQWTPQPPYADPPVSTLPPGARALLNRMENWAQRMVATYPALAEAIRAESAAQDEAERAAPSPAADK